MAQSQTAAFAVGNLLFLSVSIRQIRVTCAELRRSIRVPFFSCLAIVFLFVACSKTGGPLIAPPTPPIVFRGIIGDTLYELEGNWPQYPNTCVLHGDTIMTFMCSKDYNPSPVPSGCYIRLDIYPFIRDSLDTSAITDLSTKWSLLKFARFDESFTESYQVVPGDSMYSDRFVRGKIGAIERTRGGRVSLSEFAAQAPSVSGTSAPSSLSISKGTIGGTVQ